MSKPLIAPHGGTLVNRVLTGGARDAALARAQNLPRLELSERSLADLECLTYGIYSPLEGFVSKADYHRVVREMRLANGTVWSVPVTLQVSEEAAAQCVAEQAGASVREPGGGPLRYNKENLLNPHFIVTKDETLFEKASSVGLNAAGAQS